MSKLIVFTTAIIIIISIVYYLIQDDSVKVKDNKPNENQDKINNDENDDTIVTMATTMSIMGDDTLEDIIDPLGDSDGDGIPNIIDDDNFFDFFDDDLF